MLSHSGQLLIGNLLLMLLKIQMIATKQHQLCPTIFQPIVQIFLIGNS